MRNSVKFAASGLAVLSLVTAACGKEDTEKKAPATTTTMIASSDTEAGSSGISVSEAWCRASAAMAEAGACYMTITNGTDSADALVTVSVDAAVAATAEVHETVSEGGMDHESGMSDDTSMAQDQGSMDAADHDTATTMPGAAMMKMQPVDKLEVPAGETVKLEPGGYHIMLLDLAEPLVEGSTITLTLTFSGAGEKTVDAEVRAS